MRPESNPPDAGRTLREIELARQHPGEPRRRWFTSSNSDLFVWVDEAGVEIVAMIEAKLGQLVG